MNSRIIKTPQPPYYAVIFSSLRTAIDDGYTAANENLINLIQADYPGYLGIESYREENGHGVSIVYFRHYEDILRWRTQAEHMDAKKRGKAEWYHHYNIRIARVEHEYGSFHTAATTSREANDSPA